jgi:hypothetical protein
MRLKNALFANQKAPEKMCGIFGFYKLKTTMFIKDKKASSVVYFPLSIT